MVTITRITMMAIITNNIAIGTDIATIPQIGNELEVVVGVLEVLDDELVVGLDGAILVVGLDGAILVVGLDRAILVVPNKTFNCIKKILTNL
jgi:hypothetical protein